MTQTITVMDALELIKNGNAILIDVREPDEFRSEHITYAMSIPLGSLRHGLESLELSPSTIILFQCLKGTRGQTACECAQKMNLPQNTIMNIEGGIKAWKENGLPIVRVSDQKQLHPVSLFKQVQIVVGFLIAFCVTIGFLMEAKSAFALAGVFGAMLLFAGITGWCGLAILLSKMPWNQ